MNDRTEHSGVWPVVANKRNRKSCSSATFGNGTAPADNREARLGGDTGRAVVQMDMFRLEELESISLVRALVSLSAPPGGARGRRDIFASAFGVYFHGARTAALLGNVGEPTEAGVDLERRNATGRNATAGAAAAVDRGNFRRVGRTTSCRRIAGRNVSIAGPSLRASRCCRRAAALSRCRGVCRVCRVASGVRCDAPRRDRLHRHRIAIADQSYFMGVRTDVIRDGRDSRYFCFFFFEIGAGAKPT